MAAPERSASPSASETSSSVTDPLDDRNDEGWEDIEPDDEPMIVTCLFNDQTFTTPVDMLHHCKNEHSFDIWKTRSELGLDFLGMVKLINYIRSEVRRGTAKPDVSSATQFEDEQYLKPVLEDDPMLYSIDEIIGDEAAESTAMSQIEELREQLAAIQSQFTAYREEVQKVLAPRMDEDGQNDIPSSSSLTTARKLSANKLEKYESDYFTSYAHSSIHSTMLRDTIRTDAYRDFIYDNKSLFAGKVVLDVGCGTGILSMFCAKAGAKLVVAVDNSSIIDKARQNVFNNGLQDVIKCLRGKIEEVTLPVQKVDVIVSEWMGYCLLYESMLDSVIWARDKYLNPDGLMVPSHATIRIAPLADSELVASHDDFWKDVYGFNMSSMLDDEHEEVVIDTVGPDDIAAESATFLTIDMHTATTDDLTFEHPFTLEWTKETRRLEGFVIWFDMFFLRHRSEQLRKDADVGDAKKKGIIAFSTGPATKTTHWQQGVLLLRKPSDHFKQGTTISGHVGYRKKKGQERSLDIEVQYTAELSKSRNQTWFLN